MSFLAYGAGAVSAHPYRGKTRTVVLVDVDVLELLDITIRSIGTGGSVDKARRIIAFLLDQPREAK